MKATTKGIERRVLRSGATATIILLMGLAATYFALPDSHPVDVFSAAALGVLASLSVSTAVEARQGVRNLIRVDLLMLWVLYGLTFLEFVFTQTRDLPISTDSAISGTTATLVGFGAIAIGRTIVPWREPGAKLESVEIAPSRLFSLFVLSAFMGYFYMLIAVQFDIFEMIRLMSQPRFTQPWSRERLGGDIYSLLVELGAMLYLVPPTAALILARAKEFSVGQKTVVSLVTLLTFYYGFTSGTRNILAVYVITAAGAYLLVRPMKLWKAAMVGAGILALLVLVTSAMLEFRNVGFSNFSFGKSNQESLFIDNNMTIISLITAAFPDQYAYLGMEIPFNALVHPIPRALWPGKPEGLSVSIESIAGTNQATIAATFVGEAYMSGGVFGVLLFGLAIGVMGEMWNRVGRELGSTYSQLLYASGFFCAAISMRSILWATVTMLPSVALWVYGKVFLTRTKSRTYTPH